jgi:hypothetical protein
MGTPIHWLQSCSWHLERPYRDEIQRTDSAHPGLCKRISGGCLRAGRASGTHGYVVVCRFQNAAR